LTGLPSASAAALAARLSAVSQRADMPALTFAMRYVPAWTSCTSNVLRYLPVPVFCNSPVLPSGAVAVTWSRRIGTWSGKNSWLDTAPSKVTHTSLPLTTACEGMIHCLCAAADSGSSAAIARASRDVRFMDDSLIEGKMRARSGREPERYRAEFAAALRAAGLRGLDRPAERDLEQFAAADLAHRLDHQGVLARRQLRQLRVRSVEAQFVRARRARGAGHAVDRHLQRAPGPAPPLAQVGQPLGAVAFAGVLAQVPDGKVGRVLAAGAFDEHRHVGPVVFGDFHLRDLHRDGDVGGMRREGEQAAEGDGQLDAHGEPRVVRNQWMNSSASSAGISRPRPTQGQVMRRWRACICSRSRPVMVNTTQARAKMSMNQPQAGPVLRPLCRSLR